MYELVTDKTYTTGSIGVVLVPYRSRFNEYSRSNILDDQYFKNKN